MKQPAALSGRREAPTCNRCGRRRRWASAQCLRPFYAASGSVGWNIPPVVFGGELYFVGDDGSLGGELFACDGSNVRLVADLIAGVRGSFPSPLLVAGNRLACLAGDLLTGRRLAVSDGSTQGTQSSPESATSSG